jgi:polyisoprenyl-phosphate glycosyltransferase
MSERISSVPAPEENGRSSSDEGERRGPLAPAPNARTLVSVVLSFRNEAASIPILVSRLHAALSTEPVEYELIFVNDASTDHSFHVLLQQREQNPRVKIITMSRRFGVAECVRAGMGAARGNAIVYMDADLQDPPELIPELLRQWRDGADVVHTVRTRRHGESRMKMWLTRLAYRLIRVGSTIDLPVDAGDFKLLSRRAVDHLLQLTESDPYLRGLVVWIGFRQTVVGYERDARHAGRSHFPFFSRNPWKTFVLGLTSFSFAPIYACGVLAALGLLGVFALLAATLILVATGSPTAGPTALLALITFFWTTLVGAIGLVGLYVARTYKDVRRRPQYLVESTVGLADHVADAPRSQATIER